jgi:tetratricopeptide (TPR) repeat protein
VQKRNHILKAAIAALTEKRRQLLSILALLSEAVDYPTLSALNPHLPADEVQASRELAETVRDLRRRGLLQFDAQTQRYDLHPVVRGVAAGGLASDERERYGQRVVDHFSKQSHDPYDQAETLDDVRAGLHVVRTLVKMCKYQQAYNAYQGDLAIALVFNLEANAETLSLLRPFFPQGWSTAPETVDRRSASYLVNAAAMALQTVGQLEEALRAHSSSLRLYLLGADWRSVLAVLRNISTLCSRQNRLAQGEHCDRLGLEVASLIDDREALFVSRLIVFAGLGRLGRWAEAEAMWKLLDPMGRNWSRAVYRPGGAEWYYARSLFWQGTVTEGDFARAERLVRSGKDRWLLRELLAARAEWYLEQGQWALAAENSQEAVRMARLVGQYDARAEAVLALAKLHLGQLAEPEREAERLTGARWFSRRWLAELWIAIGDREKAERHALAAYRWAWADGEPYVFRYELDKARALLEKLGAEIPSLPPYDPATAPKLPFAEELEAAIDKLRAKKEAEQKAKS